jgi:uncharacterized LabA/DUF88 family protein
LEGRVRTSIYVDGFNLYFGALKGTPYKWLNIKAMCEGLLNPENEIGCIKYFTAHVSGSATDPDKAIHQQLYIRALRRMVPQVEVILGQFRSHEVRKRLVNPPPIGSSYALVHDRTEKGSDVNLAVHLVNDAWLNKYDCAVVVSGDSDLAESIRLVRAQHKKKVVGVISPRKGSMSKELLYACSFVRAISTSVLAGSQFPNHIPGTTIFKPADW